MLADQDGLEAMLVERCQMLQADWRRIGAHTCYHWWRRERCPRRS